MTAPEPKDYEVSTLEEPFRSIWTAFFVQHFISFSVPWLTKNLIDKNHVLLAGLYGSSNQAAAAKSHLSAAAALKGGIFDLFWDSTKV